MTAPLDRKRDPRSRSLDPERDPRSRSLDPERDPRSRSLDPEREPWSLELEGVKKRLAGRWVLDGVTLSWRGAGVLAVTGENGAGKSTLLRIVAGVLAADEGTVRIGGASLATRRVEALSQVGYAPEAAELPPAMTAADLCALVASLKSCPRPTPALVARLGLAPLLREPLHELSLGQRRRVALLAALTGDPALLVLDEPTNGLDAEGLELCADLLRERARAGRAVLVATHDQAFLAAVPHERRELRAGRIAG